MKLKTRLEYVEEFRKITALEKLPTLKEGFGDLFLQNKQENTKFLRTRDQPNIAQIQLNLFNYKFLENQLIDQYRKDGHKPCIQELQKRQSHLYQQTKDFYQWSHQLVTYPKQKNYEYKFCYGKASPPVAVNKSSTGVQASNFQISSQKDQNLSKEIQQIKALNYKRYDFHEINKHFAFASNTKDDDEQSDKRADLMKVQAEKFRSYKTLQQIDKIHQLDIIYDHFGYQIDPNQMVNQTKTQFYMRYNIPKENPIVIEMKQSFKYLSAYKSNQNFNIQFFRDLGMPSRQINKYVRNSFKDSNLNNHRKDQQENVMMQDKIDTRFLYFLTPTQLKIDPKKLNFYDVANVSMGRVTNLNSHMCIRSQKVTRGQYEKLLKKVQRLYKMQTQGNNSTIDRAIVTDNIQETLQNKDIFEKANQEMPTQKIIDEILAIRKEMFTFQPRQNHKIINSKNVSSEINSKMYKLLQKLYNNIVKEMDKKYPINEIYQHLNQISGSTQQQYDKKRLLWFILTVLEEIQSGKHNQKDLRKLLMNQKKNQPNVVKYKGNKIVGIDTMGPKSLYFMGKVPRVYQLSSNKDKSYENFRQEKSPSFKTPTKSKSPINTSKTGGNVYVEPKSINKKSVSPLKIKERTALKNNQNTNSKYSPTFGGSNQKSTTPQKSKSKTPQKQGELSTNSKKKLQTSNSITTQKKNY